MKCRTRFGTRFVVNDAFLDAMEDLLHPNWRIADQTENELTRPGIMRHQERIQLIIKPLIELEGKLNVMRSSRVAAHEFMTLLSGVVGGASQHMVQSAGYEIVEPLMIQLLLAEMDIKDNWEEHLLQSFASEASTRLFKEQLRRAAAKIFRREFLS